VEPWSREIRSTLTKTTCGETYTTHVGCRIDSTQLTSFNDPTTSGYESIQTGPQKTHENPVWFITRTVATADVQYDHHAT
jgi:hypothetical protein